jgi:type I restriction enzyme R subunit
LSEKGFGKEQIGEVKGIISADNSDIFELLGHIAFASETQSREDRVQSRNISSNYADKPREFLDFVLSQYVSEGVGKLATEKLPDLLALKFQSTRDAVAELGNVARIRNLFISFQPDLYS